MWGFITGVVLSATCLFAYIRLGFAEVASDATPSQWESRLMRAAVVASVQRRASQLKAPAPVSDDALVEGGRLYVAGCTGCHGEIKRAGIDLSHYPRVPQFAHAPAEYSEAEMFWIVKHGVRMTAMSAYGPFYSDQQMWAIAGFLHRIRNLPPTIVDRIQSK